jgi:hypothetical protein
MQHTIRVFTARAVMVAGIVDLVLGLAVLGLGMGLLIGWHARDGVPLGLALSVIAVLLVVTGLGRVTARLEIHPDKVAWRWNLSRHEIPLGELEDAALVEKGSPSPGASWAGFLAGGFSSALAWRLVDLATAFFRSEPSLGAFDLVVIRHRGGAVEVRPISCWSTRSSHSEVNEALGALQQAIHSSGHPVEEGPRILLHDEWDTA